MLNREGAHCQLCESGRFQTLFIGGDVLCRKDGFEFAVVQCAECGLRYVHPQPTASDLQSFYPPFYYAGDITRIRTGLELLAKRFAKRIRRVILEEYYGYPTTCQSSLWRTFRKWLFFPDWCLRRAKGRDFLPYIGTGKLLDVGCGRGVNLMAFQDQGWNVSGIEISASAAQQARALVGDCVHEGTLDTAPFRDESFDLIVFNHSLEHMFKPKMALLRAARLLKPEGMLVITVPNSDGVEARLFGQQWIGWDLPRHLFHFDRSTLLALLDKVGCAAIVVRTGKGSAFFMASLDQILKERHTDRVPFRKLIEKLIVKPLCLVAGHLGYGTEITVYAVKVPLQPACGA